MSSGGACLSIQHPSRQVLGLVGGAGAGDWHTRRLPLCSCLAGAPRRSPAGTPSKPAGPGRSEAGWAQAVGGPVGSRSPRVHKQEWRPPGGVQSAICAEGLCGSRGPVCTPTLELDEGLCMLWRRRLGPAAGRWGRGPPGHLTADGPRSLFPPGFRSGRACWVSGPFRRCVHGPVTCGVFGFMCMREKVNPSHLRFH